MIGFLFALLFSTPSYGALSPEARSYLEEIPEKKLTLPYVIKVALMSADAYRIIGLDFAGAGLEELATIDPQTDTYLIGGVQYADDNSSKTSPFQPLRAKQTQWNLGLQKGWITGTQTSVKWIDENNDLQFGNLGTFGNAFISNYRQSTAEISLQQSLLKNSFGYALRRKREATRRRAESIQWSTRDKFEDTTLGFISEFYNSWLAQQQVITLREQVTRQKRLVRIMTDRAQKGAVERPDLIQMEALLAASSTRLDQAKTALFAQWEKLVIGLKLPSSFLGIDPMEVPTDIDQPINLSLKECGLKQPKKTAGIFALEKNLEGLDEDFKAAKNESLPDLKLVAGYRGNSIDSSASTNFQNVVQGRDEGGFGLGPVWNVGLQLNFPLDNSAARAQRSMKYIETEKTRAQLQVAVDQLKTQWRDSCRRLNTEFENEKVFSNVVKEQKKRVKAEERRFRLGRIRVNQLVTAEDDLGEWEFRSQQQAIKVRLLAWEVQKYSGQLFKQLSPHIETLLGGKEL